MDLYLLPRRSSGKPHCEQPPVGYHPLCGLWTFIIKMSLQECTDGVNQIYLNFQLKFCLERNTEAYLRAEIMVAGSFANRCNPAFVACYF